MLPLVLHDDSRRRACHLPDGRRQIFATLPFPAHQDKLLEEAVQQDPAQMEDVLNRLATLQDDAERKHVYDLDTKVQRVMALMGFSVRSVPSSTCSNFEECVVLFVVHISVTFPLDSLTTKSR